MTIQLSKYEARKQRGIAETKWRKQQKNNYEHFTVIADGVAIGFAFWIFMAILMEESLIDIGALLMALATALFTGQVLSDKANSFFLSDTKKMFIPKMLDFIERLRYSKSEGISSERRKEMKYLVRRAVVGLVASPVIAGIYVAGVAVLVGLGAGASFSVEQAWSNGLVLGFASALAFAFYPQISRVVDKVSA
jgi:hypothetical protein